MFSTGPNWSACSLLVPNWPVCSDEYCCVYKLYTGVHLLLYLNLICVRVHTVNFYVLLILPDIETHLNTKLEVTFGNYNLLSWYDLGLKCEPL